MNEVFVTVHAGTLRHPFVSRFDLNRIAVTTQRERQRMEKAVVSFRHPFADRVMGQMAVVADRDMMVAGVLPGIKVILHGVAIDARLRIVAEVTAALAIAEGERAKAEQNAQQQAKHHGRLAKPTTLSWRLRFVRRCLRFRSFHSPA